MADKAASQCAAFENGRCDRGDALTATELRSQSGFVAAETVDESTYSSLSAAPTYCGSGGSMLYLVFGDQVWSWQATGWRLVGLRQIWQFPHERIASS